MIFTYILLVEGFFLFYVCVTCQKMNIFPIPSASIIPLEKSPRLYWKEHTGELMVKRSKTDSQERSLLTTCQPAHSEACFSAVEIRAKVLAHRL